MPKMAEQLLIIVVIHIIVIMAEHLYGPYKLVQNAQRVQLTLHVIVIMAILNITSYNCRGVMNNSMYVNRLMVTSDILCIQEHLLSDDNVSFIHTISDHHRCDTRCDSYINDDGITV